jgi:hypothetical protein
MLCYYCQTEIRQDDESCQSCGEKLLVRPIGAKPKVASDNPGPERVTGEFSQRNKRAINLLIVSVSVGMTLAAIFLIPTKQTPVSEEITVEKDPARACQLFTEGYERAMSENGSDYGMSLWREAASRASELADGQLAFELSRFARSEESFEAQLNIADLCQ